MPKCVESRLALIEAAQNPDGGWGYFAGKQSWLEPTAYALLALLNEPRARPAFDRGWRLVRSWEAAGGGWRGCALSEEPHWATSLVLTLHCAMGIYDDSMEPDHGGVMTRRRFFQVGVTAAAAGVVACSRPRESAGPPGSAAVAILRASSYQADLLDCLQRGAAACGLDVRGKRVLLKPNLVECERGKVIHTQVEVLAAAVDLFERLGAAEVRIGEGPGHRRDALFLAGEAGYRAAIPNFDGRFTDLNRDDVARVGGFPGGIYLPRTALAADLVVSVARMKTHHWAGATLSMKNLFGVVPGALYGWPKNHLHQVGIDRSVAELHRIFPRSFAIVDGIVGMEGNGPIQGRARPCGALVMGADLVAVDATCCRVMGIDPDRIEYLRLASGRGHVREQRIEQRGETIAGVRTPFALIPEFQHVRLA